MDTMNVTDLDLQEMAEISGGADWHYDVAYAVGHTATVMVTDPSTAVSTAWNYWFG